ncbi:MAG: ACT domain-containing protein [Calditrichaceae bacterium]
MANITESDIRKLAEEALRQLGKSANPEVIETVVKNAVSKIDKESNVTQDLKTLQKESVKRSKNRIIITAFGKDRPGILAGLTGILAKHTCNIVDLSQKILQEFFTVMLLVDISECDADFEFIKSEMIRTGEEFDLKVIVQHEEIFNAMHRV